MSTQSLSQEGGGSALVSAQSEATRQVVLAVDSFRLAQEKATRKQVGLLEKIAAPPSESQSN